MKLMLSTSGELWACEISCGEKFWMGNGETAIEAIKRAWDQIR